MKGYLYLFIYCEGKLMKKATASEIYCREKQQKSSMFQNVLLRRRDKPLGDLIYFKSKNWLSKREKSRTLCLQQREQRKCNPSISKIVADERTAKSFSFPL